MYTRRHSPRSARDTLSIIVESIRRFMKYAESPTDERTITRKMPVVFGRKTAATCPAVMARPHMAESETRIIPKDTPLFPQNMARMSDAKTRNAMRLEIALTISGFMSGFAFI